MKKKYGSKFKKRIVEEYLNGTTIQELKNKYDIGGDHTIQNWIVRYKSGLLEKDTDSTTIRYDNEFKKKILSEITKPEDIYKISSKHGIQYKTVEYWYENREDILSKTDDDSHIDSYSRNYDAKKTEFNIEEELKVKKLERENNLLRDRNKKLLDEVEIYKEETNIKKNLERSFVPKVIKSTPSIIKGRESAIVLQWSDWHIEERVDLRSVNGLNEFNLSIADKRINQLLNDTSRIIDTIKGPYKSKKIVIHLGGDFITGNIHDELKESNHLLPTEAIIEAQNKIAGAIDFLLDKTGLPIEIVTSTGNHGRMTQKQRISTELGNSLEHYMYYVLGESYKNNKFVKFHQQLGYHTIVDIYGTLTRFHHGHFIRYMGGVGGPTISINKAISQWNKAIRNVALDVFGHFHQSLLGKSFIINGSLIGWNSYAINIKADFEPPSQNLFVIDSLRGRTMYNPIILE